MRENRDPGGGCSGDSITIRDVVGKGLWLVVLWKATPGEKLICTKKGYGGLNPAFYFPLFMSHTYSPMPPIVRIGTTDSEEVRSCSESAQFGSIRFRQRFRSTNRPTEPTDRFGQEALQGFVDSLWHSNNPERVGFRVIVVAEYH